MGHRCNLVIIENRQATVYYDHWAANSLEFELLWGPEIARKFIEEREPSPDSWLDEVWAEGGCVMDFDTQHLLWYGGLDIRYEPEQNLIAQELIESQWAGWTVEWAKEGIFDIARKAGVSIDVVSSDKQRQSRTLIQSYTHESELHNFFYADNVISFVDQGKLSWAVLCGNVRSLVNKDLTPDYIISLVQDFSKVDFEKGKSLDPDWPGFEWGAHLDFDASSLEYWNPNPCEGLQVLLKQRWPKLSIIDHGPDYLWHEAIVPSIGWPKITRQKKLVYIEFCRELLSRNNVNPIVDVLNTMTSEGEKNIQVNPHAWERRKGTQEPQQSKSSILDNLEREIKRQ